MEWVFSCPGHGVSLGSLEMAVGNVKMTAGEVDFLLWLNTSGTVCVVRRRARCRQSLRQPQGCRNCRGGPMRKMHITDLVKVTERQQLEFERSLLEVFDGLRDIDPEVADQAIHVFDDKTRAATWLANPVRSSGRRHAPAGARRGPARGRAARPPPNLARHLWVGVCARSRSGWRPSSGCSFQDVRRACPRNHGMDCAPEAGDRPS